MLLTALALAAAAAHTPAVTPPADPLDRVRCVREVQTGSIGALGRRTCRTERQWRNIRVETDREVDRLRSNGSGSQSGG